MKANIAVVTAPAKKCSAAVMAITAPSGRHGLAASSVCATSGRQRAAAERPPAPPRSEAGAGEDGPAPADPPAEVDEQPARGEHAQLVADDLNGVAWPQLAGAEQLHRQAVDRDVLGGGEEVHREHQCENRREV